MQLPKRKPGKYTNVSFDPFVTQKKYDTWERTVTRLKEERGPAAMEVSRLAELGDFSENVEYQLAKRKLRRINNRITRIELQLGHAQIIESGDGNHVVIGSTVLVDASGKERTYQILGSSETNPGRGVISHLSPIGQGLLGKKVGEEVSVMLPAGETIYTIKKIS